MLAQCIKINDKVTITIPKENREWGYNPCPDGTVATITGFSEIHYGRIEGFTRKPGVYTNRSCVEVQLPSGKKYFEYGSRLDIVDKEEYKRRVAEFRKNQKKNPDSYWDDKEFIRELPETPFWEGDVIRSSKLAETAGFPELLQVVRIDYNHLKEFTNFGTKYPAYQVSEKIGGGWTTSLSEDNMELVERGSVWKFYHNEPLSFSDIKEEASFFSMLGHTKEVRNPANSIYRWTKEEVLEAIKSGIVHGFLASSGFMGTGPHISAILFDDEELGKRVAASTLKGFENS